MSAAAPGEVVIDEEPGCAPALYPSVVKPSNGREGIRPATLQYDREGGKGLLKVVRPKQAFIPGECRVEVVHQVLRENVRVSCGERIKRLRRKRIEHRIDGIRVRGFQPGVRLKTKPCRIFLVDVVVETDGLDLLVVVARMRDALPVGATIPGGAKWAAKYCCGCAVGISVEVEHLLIEQTVLVRIAGSAAGCLSPRKLDR